MIHPDNYQCTAYPDNENHSRHGFRVFEIGRGAFYEVPHTAYLTGTGVLLMYETRRYYHMRRLDSVRD
jgi:hypothetical protein